MRILLLALALGIFAVLMGCSDATAPAADSQDQARIDPGSGSFTLMSIPVETPGGDMAHVVLVGSNLRTAGDDSLLIDVALRNESGTTLYAPAFILINASGEDAVSILNSDLEIAGLPVEPGPYLLGGFEYSDQMPDGRLLPRGLSGVRTWIFCDPGHGSFAFDARLQTAFAPGTAEISGRLFTAPDPDSASDPDRPFLAGLFVTITGPGSPGIAVSPSADGRYRARVAAAGLYEVRVDNLSMAPCAPTVVSANPLFVLITTAPDSTLCDYSGADFALRSPCAPAPPAIIPTDATPDSLAREPWTFIEGGVRGSILNLQVGFSGCEPQHDFRLYSCGGFLESRPVRIRLALVHDTAEECDAAFTGRLAFDLAPLLDRFRNTYPTAERFILELVDFQGNEHAIEVELGPLPPIR